MKKIILALVLIGSLSTNAISQDSYARTTEKKLQETKTALIECGERNDKLGIQIKEIQGKLETCVKVEREDKILFIDKDIFFGAVIGLAVGLLMGITS